MIFILRSIKQTILTTLALYFSAVTTPVLAQAAIIDAIMGGGTVIGTECVNGKVVELVSSDAITDFGPDLTLFVKPVGKTRLRKDAGYTWVDGTGDNNKDKVNFVSLATGQSEGVAHYLVGGTAANEVAEFGTSAGGTANVITGQGTHQMQFVSQTDGTITLGTMYTAELVPSDLSYNCIPAGLLPPDKPTNVVAEAHASGGMLVEFDQDGPGGDPTYYTYLAESEPGRDRNGRVVDAGGDDDTSSPFLIIADPPFSNDAGQWRIMITAVNAAGEATSDRSNWITPSVEEPPVPDAPVITDVTTGNGEATISFIAPEDNGEAITNYAYRLTGKFDDPGDFITLDPPIVESPITVAGLVSGKTYTVSIAAINANGMGPDSNEEEFTVGTTTLDFSPQFNAKITWNSAGQACNFDAPNRCFVSESVASQAGRSGKGLPDNGEFAATKDHPALELAPFNSGGNDAWKAQDAGLTKFAVEPAGKYSSIHLVATSGGSAGKKARFRVEMQYDDGTRVTSQEYDVPDWFASPTAPVYVVKGSMDRYRGDTTTGYSAEGKAAIFGVGIATDSSKTLSSITVEIIEIPNTFALLGGAATTKSFESVTSPPGAPTGVSAIGLNKSASVSFTPPTSNGGATITSYTVTSDPDSKTCTTSDAGSLTCDVTDLTNGTAYTFTVTATNALGTSAASAPSNSVTPAAPASTPECSDESIDWATAATEEGWSCAVDGDPYEYADFHVLTVVEGDSTDICKSSLPINVNNQDNDSLFCNESEGVVRAIFDWDNRSSAPNPLATRLTWLDTVSQIGSRERKDGENCGSADQTVAGRCANQLAHGLRAFVDMAGAGGPAIAALDISNLKTLFAMFAKTRKFNENISDWDTSAISDMQYLFEEAKAFNQDIGNWNTGAVKNMNEMFRGASVFNGDVSLWQTGLVTNMNYMFREATAFNQNIGTWDTASVTGMYNMFHKAKAFNQNIGQWDTSKVTTMHRMFDRAESFNQDLSKWNIENVTANSDFDALATAWCGKTFPNNGRPIGITPQLSAGCVSECSAVSEDEWALAASDSNWVCKVAGQEYEYADFHILTTNGTDVCASPVDQLPTEENGGQGLICSSDGSTVRAIYDWDNTYDGEDGEKAPIKLAWLTSVEQIGSRSGSCSDEIKTVAGRCANQLSSGKSAFRGMFGEGGVGIRNLNIDNLISLDEMFYGARGFNEDVTGWDISHVENLRRLFEGTNFDQNIGDWNTSAVTNMEATFYNTPFNQDISDWDTSQVERMGWMFTKATQFDQDISRWNTSKVRSMRSMFQNAAQFNQNISTKPVTGENGEAYTAWDVSTVTNMAYMFEKARAFNQDLSGWNVKKVSDFSNFDIDATGWCGLGFNNRGRPSDWSPTEAVGCLNVVLQAPESGSVGDEFDYVVQYYNASTTDVESGALTLELPDGVSVSDGGISDNATQSGRTITWTDIEVPAGSSANSGGGELKVGVEIGAGVTDGTELLASATLTDGAATSVNDVAGTIVSVKSVPVLKSTIDEAAETVLPGEVIEYALSVENVGQSPTEGGDMTLTWEGDVPFTIEGKGGATCNGTSCRWVGELAPNESRSQTVQVRIGVDAAAGARLTATLSASATNELEGSDSNASVTTEILALPLPELKVDVTTQPQGVVDVGAQFTTFVDLSNTGSGSAVSTTVTLDIGSATYVGAAVGDAPSYDSNSNAVTWTVDNLKPNELKGLAVRLQAPQAEGAVLLESEVSTTTTAGDVISDSASQTLSVTGAAVLDLQLSLDPEDQLLPGDPLDMTFAFQNIGNAAALEVVLATKTPVDTTLLAWPDYARCGADDCSEGYAGEISLELGTVRAKERETANLSVLVNETAEEQTLSVAGSLTGTNTVGDALVPQAAAASVRVAAITEDVLAVSQRADRQTVAPGQVVVYEITYQNLSSEAVTNVTLTGVLPKDTRLLNQTGGTVTIDPDTQETTWQLTIESLGSLETGKVLLQVEVVGNAVIGTSLDNSVSMSTALSTVWADPAEVKVVANAAVLESSISNPESTAPGDSFTYALRFANTGTLAASNTTLQMQVEDGVTVTDCDDCSKTEGGRLSWSLSALAAGADQTKQITVRVDPSVAANSELHAISYIGDSQSAGAVGVSGKLSAQQQRRRGSASATQATSAAERAGPLGVSTIRVGEKASPALGGLKIVAPAQVVAGDPVAVTVAFGNTGGAPATGVTLTSTVPTNSTLTRVEGGSCSADPCVAGETITWNVGEVAAESTREVSYSLTADSDAAGSVIGHRVVLNSAESREESVSANTDIVAEKLSVSIAVQDAAGNNAEGNIVSVGDTLTYTLTLLNNSPTGRSGITVVNSVPPAVAACGQACIGGDGKGAAIDAEAGTLTWSSFALDAGAEVTLNYQVTIPSGLANNTPLINSVSVSTATRFDDSARSTVTVASQAKLVLSMTAPGVLQDGAQGGVTLSYQNTGTAATAATLRYVLPNNATMIDSDSATVSGSTYTWNLGNVAEKGAAGSAGSRTVTIEASGAADSSLLHTASVTGTETSDTAEATTAIGLREELALSLSAPGSVNTDAGFTASLTAQNTGNAAANATALSLTLPAGFTASALDGGTLDNAPDSAPGSQVVRWSVDLAAGASMTLSPTVTAPSAAGKAVLLAGLTATSGKTQSASADVQVTMATSAIITAGAQFSVPEAKAGDSVTLIAGPANVGGAASGTITNTVTLSAGLTATAFDSASWNASTRVLSWTTSSLSSRGSDPKNFTVRVEDAGALTATASSNGAEGTATMVRTFPEEVTITPENPDSSCKISGQPVVAAAPTPPAGITLSFANTVGFTVIDCDRESNTSYPETLTVKIDVGQAIAADAQLYKVSDAGAWAVIEDAVITGQTVTYSITDDGDLDQDKTRGTLRDPVALAVPEGEAPAKPVIPVPLPLWLLVALMGALGWLGYRRLRLA